MSSDLKIYTQDEVDNLRRQWEAAAFELKTKEVLGQINRRLNESNDYKATIGKDLKVALENQKELKDRIEAIEEARQLEIVQVKENLDKRRSWFQDRWVRFGIAVSVFYELVQILHTIGIF